MCSANKIGGEGVSKMALYQCSYDQEQQRWGIPGYADKQVHVRVLWR